MVVDEVAELLILFGGRGDNVDGLFDIGRKEDEVVASTECRKFGSTVLVGVGNAFHVDTVGNNDSLEAKCITKQTVDDDGAEGGGALTVVGIDLQVSHHDATDAILDKTAERKKFDRIKMFARMVYHGEFQVAVDLGVTVTREVFGESHNPLALLSFGEETSQTGDSLGVVAVGAGTDDGILGIGIDVGHGGIVEMDTHHAALAPHFDTHLVDQAVEFGLSKSEAGVTGERIHVLETHAESPFTVNADKQGHRGILPETAGDFGLTVGCTGEKAYTTDTVTVHLAREVKHLTVVHVQRDTYNHQLGYTLL